MRQPPSAEAQHSGKGDFPKLNKPTFFNFSRGGAGSEKRIITRHGPGHVVHGIARVEAFLERIGLEPRGQPPPSQKRSQREADSDEDQYSLSPLLADPAAAGAQKDPGGEDDFHQCDQSPDPGGGDDGTGGQMPTDRK